VVRSGKNPLQPSDDKQKKLGPTQNPVYSKLSMRIKLFIPYFQELSVLLHTYVYKCRLYSSYCY